MKPKITPEFSGGPGKQISGQQLPCLKILPLKYMCLLSHTGCLLVQTVIHINLARNLSRSNPSSGDTFFSDTVFTNVCSARGEDGEMLAARLRDLAVRRGSLFCPSFAEPTALTPSAHSVAGSEGHQWPSYPLHTRMC